MGKIHWLTMGNEWFKEWPKEKQVIKRAPIKVEDYRTSSLARTVSFAESYNSSLDILCIFI